MIRSFFVALFICCGPAFAWDPIGDLKDPARILRNIEREARAAAQAAANAERERQVQLHFVFLEAWLNESRKSSSNGAVPLPPQIREVISDFYPAYVLDRARYKVGDVGTFNLGALSIQYGGAQAVTLNDVIVFKSKEDAETNTVLWAHELKHVKQFADWGVRDFAIRYLRDWNAVEAEAYAADREFQSQLVRAPAGGDFNGDGKVDKISLFSNGFVIRLDGKAGEIRRVISPDYNTRLGLWLTLNVNPTQDRCTDLVHIITAGADRPHYAHTHFSTCDGNFGGPDKLQFNAPGVANPQGDYNTALGFWQVKPCGGRNVLAHNPMLPDGRNHFWYPQYPTPDGALVYRLSSECR